jgi:hypothetical protein
MDLFVHRSRKGAKKEIKQGNLTWCARGALVDQITCKIFRSFRICRLPLNLGRIGAMSEDNVLKTESGAFSAKNNGQLRPQTSRACNWSFPTPAGALVRGVADFNAAWYILPHRLQQQERRSTNSATLATDTGRDTNEAGRSQLALSATMP